MPACSRTSRSRMSPAMIGTAPCSSRETVAGFSSTMQKGSLRLHSDSATHRPTMPYPAMMTWLESAFGSIRAKTADHHEETKNAKFHEARRKDQSFDRIVRGPDCHPKELRRACPELVEGIWPRLRTGEMLRSTSA